jgi:hypothetical protein
MNLTSILYGSTKSTVATALWAVAYPCEEQRRDEPATGRWLQYLRNCSNPESAIAGEFARPRA